MNSVTVIVAGCRSEFFGRTFVCLYQFVEHRRRTCRE
ncbi:Uncharacterised protein [Segatella copri]|nr:Uncharacterised protein [Segatella copri]